MFFFIGLFLFYGSFSAMHNNNTGQIEIESVVLQRNLNYSRLPNSLAETHPIDPDENYMEALAERPECPALACLCLSFLWLGSNFLSSSHSHIH